MEPSKERLWVVCLKSKREPIRVEATTVTNENGQYVFTDDSGVVAGRYDTSAVEGYSVVPVSVSSKPGITVIVDGAPSE